MFPAAPAIYTRDPVCDTPKLVAPVPLVWMPLSTGTGSLVTSNRSISKPTARSVPATP